MAMTEQEMSYGATPLVILVGEVRRRTGDRNSSSYRFSDDDIIAEMNAEMRSIYLNKLGGDPEDLYERGDLPPWDDPPPDGADLFDAGPIYGRPWVAVEQIVSGNYVPLERMALINNPERFRNADNRGRFGGLTRKIWFRMGWELHIRPVPAPGDVFYLTILRNPYSMDSSDIVPYPLELQDVITYGAALRLLGIGNESSAELRELYAQAKADALPNLINYHGRKMRAKNRRYR